MAEIFKTRRLKIASAIFVTIIVVGFITLSVPKFKYSATIDETITGLSDSDYMITSEDASEIILSNNNKYLFIDIRNPQEYLMNHISNALNIPASEILEDENFEYLMKLDSDDNTMILYGNEPLQANGPLLILTQLGIKNLKLLTSDLAMELMTNPKLIIKQRQIEKPIFNDLDVKQLLNPGSPNDTLLNVDQQKITPVKVHKKTTASGGC
jgi:rhodanese-related sulfurtransferase